MKKLLFLAFVPSLLLMACKKESTKKMTIVKDCTGSYIRSDGKDYHVCNPETINAYASGTAVTVSYKTLKECNGSAKDQIVCMMLHQSEGWVEVVSVR